PTSSMKGGRHARPVLGHLNNGARSLGHILIWANEVASVFVQGNLAAFFLHFQCIVSARGEYLARSPVIPAHPLAAGKTALPGFQGLIRMCQFAPLRACDEPVEPVERAGRTFVRARVQAFFLAMLIWPVQFAFLPQAHSETKEIRRVLIFNQLSPFASPGLRLMDEAIVEALQKSPYQIELYSENLETTLFPDEHSQEKFRNWYIEKYRDRKPDVIFAAGPDAIRFLYESHDEYFPGIPVVFCGSTEEMLVTAKLG